MRGARSRRRGRVPARNSSRTPTSIAAEGRAPASPQPVRQMPMLQSVPVSLPRLADFIREDTEQILSEWEAFARAMPIAESMDIDALRDHAKAMLFVIATDLETPQTVGEETA